MRRITMLLISAACFVGMGNAYADTDDQATDGYALTWSDEFDTNTIGTNWNVEVVSSPSNNEMQYYTSRTSNVKIENGNMVLTARREDYGGRYFTSGRVNSQGKVTYKYGKIVARIKMPKTARGLWPAFWLMGNDINTVNWPKCGEIDIVEAGNSGGFGGNEEKYFSGAIHWGETWQSHQYWAPGAVTNSYSVEDDYHLYIMEWDENTIKCYLDDQTTPYFTASIGGGSASCSYMHKHVFVLFNLAVGGDFPGITTASGITALPNSGSEASMYVDYVRVYQKSSDVVLNPGNNIIDEEYVPSAEDIVSAPTPAHAATDVKSLFSDHYTAVNSTAFFDTWGSPNEQVGLVKNVSGDNIEKVTNFGYVGFNFDGNYAAVNMSTMDYMHLDVYASKDMSNILVTPISQGPNETDIRVNLTGSKWNSLDMKLSDFKAKNANIDYTKAFQIKLAGGDQSGIIYLDNIYFYKGEPTGIDDVVADKGQTGFAKRGIYTLGGQHVATDSSNIGNLPKGLYIVDGKKTAIK